MLPDLESSVWRDAIVFHNTRVRLKGTSQEGIVLSPKVENDCLFVWWGTQQVNLSSAGVVTRWVPISELEEINVEEITCVPDPFEVSSENLEANAPEGKGDVSNE